MNIFIAKIGLRMFDKGTSEFDINSLGKILTCDENTASVMLGDTRIKRVGDVVHI